MNIAITIPAFNEEKTISALLDKLKQVIRQNGYNAKILVVDDGSKDRTAEIAKSKGAVVFRHPSNLGLAETFRTEMEQILLLNPDIIVHIDADSQYLPEEIHLLVNEINKGADLVLGSRFKGKIEHMPIIKRIGNKAFSNLISRIIQKHFSDFQTGFRAFTREVAEQVKITSRFTYTQEQIIRAVKQKFKVVEVPVHFNRRHGKSRLMKGPFDYALKAGVNLFRIYRDYEPLKFFGLFGAIIFLPGFLLGIWLTYLFLTTGIVGHFPSIMLAVLLISISIQVWLFAFLADMLRK